MNNQTAENRSSNFIFTGIIVLALFTVSEIFLHFRYPSHVPPAKPAGWAIIPEQSWIEYNPDLGWFHRKNRNARLRKNSLEVPVTTNSLGLRGTQEYQIPKAPGKYRVYAAGDSFTFGFGVWDDEVFTRQLEIINPDWEVFNLGVAGYGIDQIHLLLKKFGFDYKPDAVLILIYPEDLWRATRAFNDAGFGKPYYKLKNGGKLELQHVPVPKEKDFSIPQFPDFQELSFADRLFGWSRWYVLGKKALTRLKKLAGLEDPDSSPEWMLGRSILRETVKTIRAAGARPVLVMVPPQRWLTGTVEPVRNSMKRFAEREKAEFLDLTPVFEKAIQEKGGIVDDYYIPDDLHWTAEGHALVTDAISEFLKQSPPKK